jgi:hypothetical protein
LEIAGWYAVLGLFAEGAEVDSLHAAGEADVLEELGVGGFGERGAVVLSEESEGGLGGLRSRWCCCWRKHSERRCGIHVSLTSWPKT